MFMDAPYEIFLLYNLKKELACFLDCKAYSKLKQQNDNNCNIIVKPKHAILRDLLSVLSNHKNFCNFYNLRKMFKNS